MTIDVEFLESGDLGYIGKLNAMVAQTNAEMQSTREYADNQVVGMQDIKTGTEMAAAQAAASAASAASVVQQDLGAIDQTFLASTTLVDICLYDTSRDSDGGVWRKRCSHTGWENETLSGNWLSSAANEAAARAISGATTGSYYYDTTAAVFYKLSAGAGVTQVYRGNARQFPARVLITTEATRLIIWDLTQAGCPMFFVSSGYSGLTSVAAANGSVAIGRGAAGIAVLSFPAGYTLSFRATASAGGVSRYLASGAFNAGPAWDGSLAAIVSDACNDIAIAVLPNAPVDVSTGLPIPTIAVATGGGVSIIKDSGTVVSSSHTYDMACVGWQTSGALMYSRSSAASVYVERSFAAGFSADTGYYSGTGIPAVPNAATTKVASGAMGSALGVVRTALGFTQASNMVAYTTKAYPSGWLPGDIRGAWLADTTVETLTGSGELVTNGDAWTGATGTTPPTGWATGFNVADYSIDAGGDGARLKLTATAGGYANTSVAITTVTGATYTVAGTLDKGTASSVRLSASTSATDATAGGLGGTVVSGAASDVLFSFAAAGATSYIHFRVEQASSYGYCDNVSCRLADVDRSVKAKGLRVVGSLTKGAVAGGAQLIGFSGFSAANYLEQPYNADLDFGTSDFCILGWLKEAPNSVAEVVVQRKQPGSDIGEISLSVLSTGVLRWKTHDGTTSDLLETTEARDDAAWHLIALVKRTGVKSLYVDGVLSATSTPATNITLSNSSAVLRVGYHVDNGSPLTNGAVTLWRAGAYAPSADQIKHIYETEKALFELGAQCCLAGTSNAVTALAYDDETDILHVGTSYGRSAFKGLVRVASEATPVGSLVALAAGAGIVAQAGATGADIYVPAYNLREELKRTAEQMARFGQNLIAHDFDATASQTIFTLPVGWEIVAVYAQGSIKREGATKDWTRSFDGFRWSVVFAAGRSASDWISILARRV